MGKIIGESITFDDVLLVPSYSEVIPNQVNLETWLTKTVKLNIPGLYHRCRACAFSSYRIYTVPKIWVCP